MSGCDEGPTAREMHLKSDDIKRYLSDEDRFPIFQINREESDKKRKSKNLLNISQLFKQNKTVTADLGMKESDE